MALVYKKPATAYITKSDGDTYQKVADHILRSQNYALYSAFNEFITKSANHILTNVQRINSFLVNGLEDEATEHSIAIKCYLLGLLDNFSKCPAVQKDLDLRLLLITIDANISSYDIDYLVNQSKSEWIVRKSQMEYYQEQNTAFITHEACNGDTAYFKLKSVRRIMSSGIRTIKKYLTYESSMSQITHMA